MHDRDQQFLSCLSDMDPAEQAIVPRQLGNDDALRDVGDHLTIERIRDFWKYAPGSKLASQIRDALVPLLERADPPEEPKSQRPRKKRVVNPRKTK